MSTDRVEEYFEIELADLEAVQTLAAQNGVDVEQVPNEGLEPVSTVVLLLIGTSLAVSTVVYLLDRRRGGQIIDLRAGALNVFRRSTDLQYGIVAVLTADGDVRVEIKEPRGMFGTVVDAITSMLPKIAGAGRDVVAAELQKSLGPDVSILAEPAASS